MNPIFCDNGVVKAMKIEDTLQSGHGRRRGSFKKSLHQKQCCSDNTDSARVSRAGIAVFKIENVKAGTMETARISIGIDSIATDLRAGLTAARRLGVRGVEFDARHGLGADELSQTGIRQIRKWLLDEGLVAVAMRFRTRRGYADPDALDARVEATKRLMQSAHGLGAPLLLNHIGDIAPTSDAAEWQLLIDVLTDIGAWGQRVGTMLAAEAGRSSPEDLARVIESLPAGSLACDLVTGALAVHGHDPVQSVATLGTHVATVHLTDAIAGAFAGRGRAVKLGTGHVEVPAVLAALEERSYRGWFGIESINHGTDGVSEVTETIDFLRRL